MIFDNTSSQNLYLPLKIDVFVIPFACKIKFLGLILDRNLKWNYHINSLVSNIAKLSGILFQVRSKLTLAAFKSLYYSLVYSKVIYCISIWGGTFEKYTNAMRVAQNRVLRSYFGIRKCDSVREIYSNLELLKFEQIYKLFCGTLIFKFQMSQYCNNVFRKVNEVHNRHTRASMFDIFIVAPSISAVEHSTIVKCPQYFNQLPLCIKQSSSLR